MSYFLFCVATIVIVTQRMCLCVLPVRLLRSQPHIHLSLCPLDVLYISYDHWTWTSGLVCPEIWTSTAAKLVLTSVAKISLTTYNVLFCYIVANLA